MTKPAFDGRDKPFSDWLRQHPKLDSTLCSLDVTDIDFAFHKYRSNVDGLGTREIKLILDLEVKTFGKIPPKPQLETLYFRHQLLATKSQLMSNVRNQKLTVWHFGQYILIIHDGLRPDDCSKLEWCQFDSFGRLNNTTIQDHKLIKLLGFVIRPDNFAPLSLRRHHKTKVYGYVDRSNDLLFPIAKYITQRS